MIRHAVVLILVASLTASCSQNIGPMPPQKSEKQPAPQANFATVDPATAATIHGTIHLTGSSPAPVEIDMGMDPGCTISSKQPNFSQQYEVGKSGGLRNVYVYVK